MQFLALSQNLLNITHFSLARKPNAIQMRFRWYVGKN